MESIRPEIQQYFVETNTNGRPFSRELRSVIYQRAKGVRDTLPFGTQQDVNEIGYEWIPHSLAPTHEDPDTCRLTVGGAQCTQPYVSSILNISAMSYGSLSKNAVLALNEGARLGDFAHNTGEGGVSPYHLKPGGDLIWQIGTGYFGCRAKGGGFDRGLYEENVGHASVKMIELKLSQGAKPGHGGILPAAKVTREISEIRGVPMGADVISPPAHTTFSTPTGLLEFIQELRERSGGKPVGFKLCVGHKSEFLGICKAMVETGILPDFIAVDGTEGGTGAAPLELSNSVGYPMRDGLLFVDNALRGVDLRDKIRVVAAGKVATGVDIFRTLALGADMCNAARSMMFALGCIQARRCHDNACPVGITTHNPSHVVGLYPPEKAERVHRYHQETILSFSEILAAAGLNMPEDIRPEHVFRRMATNQVMNFGALYPRLETGGLLSGAAPASWAQGWASSSASSFQIA
jgi:glutamate synthase domain-containing protein 2